MTDDNPDETDRTRRNVLLGVAGLGAAGLFGAGRASAQVTSTPSGEVGNETNPYVRAYINRQVFVARTSDPTSPDGTIWYRSDQ